MRERTELMYDFPSYLIALAVFGLILLAIWLGSRLGYRLRNRENKESRVQAQAVQGSLLGLLALLLGFTFSLSLARYDLRSAEVVGEANAIGTAWLRTDLVGEGRRGEVKDLMRRYAELRLEAAGLTAANDSARPALVAQAGAVFADLWQLAAAEARETRDPVTMGFVASLNDMIDALAARDAAIARHVPELVLFLLLGTFVLLGGVVGYTATISSVRPGFPVYALMALIAVLVFLILDLDRPRRGLIAVDQSALVATVAMMRD
ncbi:MAG: hypothetical protein IPL38_12890 [Rhodobacter sp.]|nr:hypothetical protein [Rhodobacter sp.]MBK8440334.1 hypothetical protein [Rhodobacter sp.]